MDTNVHQKQEIQYNMAEIIVTGRTEFSNICLIIKKDIADVHFDSNLPKV